MTKTIVCKQCGSEMVRRDAWGEWDSTTQQWVLADVFDYAYCLDCDQDTELEDKEVDGLTFAVAL